MPPHEYDCLLAVSDGRGEQCTNLFELDRFLQEKQGWTFGHLSYELKNNWFPFQSDHPDPVGFPPAFFFEPTVILQLTDTALKIQASDPAEIFRQIQDVKIPETNIPSVFLRQRMSKEEYLQTIQILQQHIIRGDCYEINFCQEFYAEPVKINPVDIFHRLTSLSPNPFSALYKLHQRYLICASPERYLVKKGDRILSQPMKGTIKRDLLHPELDAELKMELKQSAKDRSENVMVVDMVRNDLSRICEEGTVKVDELFGVYTYPQVHQMISTISGKLKQGLSFSSLIEATFPMGSMTGAPKHRVIELIDQYENSIRGIFSGSVGYIDPQGNFDLNVVIRSIMYNEASGYLSYQVGSGITYYSDPGKEWEECLLKGAAMKKILEGY